MRSAANLTRSKARELLQMAAEIPIRPKVNAVPPQEANRALLALKRSHIDGTAVFVVS